MMGAARTIQLWLREMVYNVVLPPTPNDKDALLWGAPAITGGRGDD